MPAPARAPADDAPDDLVDAEAGGVELDRVVGRPQGAVLALESRASRSRCASSDVAGVLAALGGAAAGALVVGRGEEDLQRRIGADHGADVAALGDVRPAAISSRWRATIASRTAGGRRPARRRAVTSGVADRGR